MRRPLVAALLAEPAAAPANSGIAAARYAAPTGRHPHGTLGDATEYAALDLSLGGNRMAATLDDAL